VANRYARAAGGGQQGQGDQMTPAFSTPVRTLALLLVVGFAAGCAFTVGTDPNAYPVAADDFPALPAATKVEIVNSFSSSYIAKMGHNQQADLHEFTQTGIVVLGRALEKKGATVGAGGKRIVLQVFGPALTQGFGFVRASVSLQAELGAAKVDVWGEAAGTNASHDFSAAITHAVEALLRKPELREYLSKP
jgi:hypothetical protein